MKTQLAHSMFNFYDFKIEAKNPKTNEIKMVDWFKGKVTIEREKSNSFWYVRSYSEKIRDFWLEKFGTDYPIFKSYEYDKFKKLLKETAMFVEAPYIEGCALTKEWIRYQLIN